MEPLALPDPPTTAVACMLVTYFYFIGDRAHRPREHTYMPGYDRILKYSRASTSVSLGQNLRRLSTCQIVKFVIDG
jgi:hypothetical protein